MHNYLPLNFTLFSEKLAKAGWMNHFIGKGHLSYLTTDHLPINRGFASHVGYLNAEESYLWGNSSATPPKAGKTQWLPSDAPNGTYAKDFWDGHAPGVTDVNAIYYSTNYYTNVALDIIKAHPPQKPLFIHL